MSGNVIYIRFSEDLSIGQPKELGRLLNRLRFNMEMAEWRSKNRAARPSEDPDTWDWKALESLELEYETVGLP